MKLDTVIFRFFAYRYFVIILCGSNVTIEMTNTDQTKRNSPKTSKIYLWPNNNGLQAWGITCDVSADKEMEPFRCITQGQRWHARQLCLWSYHKKQINGSIGTVFILYIVGMFYML